MLKYASPAVCTSSITRFAALLTLASILGCGGQEKSGPRQLSEHENIYVIVDSLCDRTTDTLDFENQFAPGAKPPTADMKRYRGYRFEAVSSDISGNSATAQVIAKDSDGNKIAEMEWTLQNDDDCWRLKTVPLPDDWPVPPKK